MAQDNNLFGKVEELIIHLKEYVDLKVTDLKLKLLSGWIKFVSDIILLIFVMVVAFFSLLFLSFAFAYWFGEETGNYPLAFLITAAFWGIIGLLVYLFRKPLILDHVARATTQDLFEAEIKEDLLLAREKNRNSLLKKEFRIRELSRDIKQGLTVVNVKNELLGNILERPEVIVRSGMIVYSIVRELRNRK
jgi:hypothetical protein